MRDAYAGQSEVLPVNALLHKQKTICSPKCVTVRIVLVCAVMHLLAKAHPALVDRCALRMKTIKT